MNNKKQKKQDNDLGIQLCAYEKALQKDLSRGSSQDFTRQTLDGAGHIAQGCYETIPTRND